MDDNSDEEYQVNEKELEDDQPTASTKKSTTKKSRQTTTTAAEPSEQDEETVEIIKKFRHVNVPVTKRSRKRSKTNESTTISTKNRSDELYVLLNDNDDDDSPRKILSGSQLDSTKPTKKTPTIQSFQFDRRQIKMNSVEDTKAPWRCILCWKVPYENYLGPLFGPYSLNEHCQTYLKNSNIRPPPKKKTKNFLFFNIFYSDKQLSKDYRRLKEIWLHRDCAIWNNHIQMSPTTGELLHVSDACSTYLDIVCGEQKTTTNLYLTFFSLLRNAQPVKYQVQLLHVGIEIVKYVTTIHV